MISMRTNKLKNSSPTIITDKEWADSHIYNKDSWKDELRDALEHPHRSVLLDKISLHAPFSHILEIGCGYGSNLYYIAQKFPKTELRGIDINPMAVKHGNIFFKEKGISNVQLSIGEAQNLKKFQDKYFDIILTDAVLIYISPEEITPLVREMLRVAKVLVLTEWHCFNTFIAAGTDKYYCFKLKYETRKFKGENMNFLSCLFKPKYAQLGFYTGHWTRDYFTLMKTFVPREHINITKLPKECWNDKRWRKWGAIIEVDAR